MNSSRISVVTLMALLLCVGVQAQNNIHTQFNLKKGIALEGYDAVSYFQGKPLKGLPNYRFTFQSVTYQFATAANLKVFRSNPSKYIPAYGGWCAYAVGASNEKVKIDPLTYKISHGRLFLFYNFKGNNTLLDWNDNEAYLTERADENWKKWKE